MMKSILLLKMAKWISPSPWSSFWWMDMIPLSYTYFNNLTYYFAYSSPSAHTTISDNNPNSSILICAVLLFLTSIDFFTLVPVFCS